MPLNRIRVAVVGAGYVANHHLAALGSVDFVELVGICDTNLEAARSMAVRHSIPLVVADLAELLEQSRPDAVHVLTPPASHAAIALAAMEHRSEERRVGKEGVRKGRSRWSPDS